MQEFPCSAIDHRNLATPIHIIGVSSLSPDLTACTACDNIHVGGARKAHSASQTVTKMIYN